MEADHISCCVPLASSSEAAIQIPPVTLSLSSLEAISLGLFRWQHMRMPKTTPFLRRRHVRQVGFGPAMLDSLTPAGTKPLNLVLVPPSLPAPKPVKCYNSKMKGSKFLNMGDSLITEAVSIFSAPPAVPSGLGLSLPVVETVSSDVQKTTLGRDFLKPSSPVVVHSQMSQVVLGLNCPQALPFVQLPLADDKET